jgi:hypothetical protein
MVAATLREIMLNHAGRYPAMQVQDVYKLLHQAALGSEHAVCDEQAARDWLERELTEMNGGPDDPLFDPISPDGQILRIHLRPYTRAGKNPETLLRAFVQTANEWHGSLETLKGYGAAAAGWPGAETGSIRPDELKTFFDKMEAQDFPAMHHSEVYKRLYGPAYRVVARQYLEEK